MTSGFLKRRIGSANSDRRPSGNGKCNVYNHHFKRDDTHDRQRALPSKAACTLRLSVPVCLEADTDPGPEAAVGGLVRLILESHSVLLLLRKIARTADDSGLGGDSKRGGYQHMSLR